MANQNRNGGRNASGDENRGSWRPQDQQGPRNYENDDDRDYRARSYHEEDRYAGMRDPQRWEGSRGSELGYGDHEDRHAGRSTERYGQGQSGYGAGRYGDDRAQQLHSQNRNEVISTRGQGRGDRYAGNRYEDRSDLGLVGAAEWQRGSHGSIDDRFTGRGTPGNWTDRSERGYNPERFGAQGGYGGGSGFESDRGGWRPDDERIGYQGQGGPGAGSQRMGYSSDYNDAQLRQDARRNWGSESQRSWGNEAHSHRGQGPHRGRGPTSYQRSDDRLREMICESLSDDDRIDATHIEVTVKNGEVTLGGTVEDRHAKRDAEDCACSVAGVRDVQNQLRVKDDRQAARMSNTGQSSANVSQPASNIGQSFTAGQSSFANGKPEAESQSQDKKPRA